MWNMYQDDKGRSKGDTLVCVMTVRELDTVLDKQTNHHLNGVQGVWTVSWDKKDRGTTAVTILSGGLLSSRISYIAHVKEARGLSGILKLGIYSKQQWEEGNFKHC